MSNPEGASYKLETVVQSVDNLGNQCLDPSGVAGFKVDGFGEGTIQTLPGKQNVDSRKYLGGSVACGRQWGDQSIFVAAGIKWKHFQLQISRFCQS